MLHDKRVVTAVAYQLHSFPVEGIQQPAKRNSPVQTRLLTGILTACVLALALPLNAKSKEEYTGQGLLVTVPVTEQQLLQAVEDVAGDGIIRGTKEYNNDEYVTGAEAAQETKAFPAWTGPGRAFYKVKNHAVDPWNFKASGDSGTLAVRYVVQHVDDKSASLRIDAIFFDDFHLRQHASNGSVEGAEYKDIQDDLGAIALKKKQAAEDAKRDQEQLAARAEERKRQQQELEMLIAGDPNETMEQHVARLRRVVERVVKSGGAQLKSAPFKSASSLETVPAGAHVVIVVSTRYWVGIETEDGQRGWINRGELEQLP